MNYQNTDKDCGKASSRTLLRLLYKSRKYEAAYFEKEEMNNFLSIQKGLKKYGVETKGYEVDQKGLDEIKRPFICQLKREDSYHFVVVSGCKNKLKIYDSSCGFYKVNKAKFFNEFTGNILEVQNKKEIEVPEIKMISFKEISVYFILSFFEMLIFIIGILLTTKFGDITYLFLGTLGSIGISFLKKYNVIYLNKKVDNRLLLPYLASYKNETKYEYLMNIKNEYFSKLTTLINQLEMLAILVIVAAIENFLLFWGICLVLVLTYFFLNFTNQKLNVLRIKANIEEKKLRYFLVKEYNKENAIKSYGQEAKIGGKYMWYYYLLRLVPFVIALIYVSVMLYQTQRLSFETLIFNGGYLITLILSLIKIDEISSKEDFSLSKIVDFEDYEKLSFDKDKVVYCAYLDKKNINQ